MWNKCLAKTNTDGTPGKTVPEHARQTAEVTRALKQFLPRTLKNLITNEIISLAALHDLGKISPGFQKKIHIDHFRTIDPKRAEQNLQNFKTDHAMIGAMALDSYFGTRSDWSEIIALHHGSKQNDHPRIDRGEIFGGEEWANARRSFIEAMFKEFGPLKNGKIDPIERNFFLGIVTLSDWIASDETLFPGIEVNDEDARNAINKCGFILPQFREGLSFHDLFHNTPYPVQENFIKNVRLPGLYVLEAPMGLGKTEAALFAAYQLMSAGYHHGFYFGLPTRLTSDKIFDRVDPFLQKICASKHRPKLAHGTAWLESFGRGGEELSAGHSWFNARKRTLLYPFAVGTIDQALLSVLRVKHFFLRTFGLAGKVVILDEVHSYDMYTGSLMEDMIRQLLDLDCTVIILSATLTYKRTRRLFPDAVHVSENAGYPLITSMVQQQVTTTAIAPDRDREYYLHMVDWQHEDVAAEAVKRAEEKQCVLCIANTVAKAQQWYDKIKAQMKADGFSVGLLHSKFPAFRRKELEEVWIGKLGKDGDRPAGCILIATQVVEQSVDIDADCLITEIAPTDMLLQRMGRQWRHKRKRPCNIPETFVVSGKPLSVNTKEEMMEALGKTNCLVYSPYVLYRTYAVWESLERINLPNNIRLLLEKTYDTPEQEDSDLIQELKKIHDKKCAKLKQIANANLSTVTALPTCRDQEGFMTRYSDIPTIDVLIVKKIDTIGRKAILTLLDGRKVEADADKPDLYVTKALHQNILTLSVYKVRNSGVEMKTADYLKKHFYQPTPVLLWDDQSGRLSFERRETNFHYTHERGVSLLTHDVDIQRGTYTDYDDDFDVFSEDW